MADRALRRLVAELACAREEDIEAVLAELGPQRRRVEMLLAEYAGMAATDPAPVAARPHEEEARPELEYISPWLADRLKRPAESGDEDDTAPVKGAAKPDRRRRFRMTPVALGALSRSAAELRPASSAPEPRRGLSLLGQVHGALLARGRAA